MTNLTQMQLICQYITTPENEILERLITKIAYVNNEHYVHFPTIMMLNIYLQNKEIIW